jgi:hypothetical protein
MSKLNTVLFVYGYVRPGNTDISYPGLPGVAWYTVPPTMQFR